MPTCSVDVRPNGAPSVDRTAQFRAARRGDEASWVSLIEDYERLLASVATRHRLSPQDREDVAQTTWLRLLEHADRIRDPDRLPGWLSTTINRECIAVRRRGWTETTTATCPDVPVDAPDVVDRLDAERRAAALHDAVDRLPLRERELVLLLLAPEPLTYREISRLLDMPVGSIGPVRQRALRRLRLLLKVAAPAEEALAG